MAILTAIIAAAKIWDAVGDLIMGIIVDNTRSRWGKLRPWLLFMPVPAAILSGPQLARLHGCQAHATAQGWSGP